MSQDALRVAIVGCGMIGSTHARAIARFDELIVVAVIDPDLPAADALARQIVAEGAALLPPSFASLADALDAGALDLVVIGTPSGTHLALADEAVAAGAHVMIEKPIDVSLARAREFGAIADRAAASGRVVSVISQHRFDPASQRVHAAVRAGELGRLTSAVASVAWWRDQAYYDSGGWRGTWSLDGGGAVANQGVHTVDLLIWLLGEPVEVSARTALLAHERIEVEDVAVATVSFANGALAVFHATTAAAPGLSVRLQVHGSSGSAVIDGDRLVTLSTLERTVDAEELAAEPLDPGDFVSGHARQLADVLAAIRDHRDPGVTVADAVETLAVVHAIYASATLGRPVAMADVRRGAYDELAVRTGVGT